MKANVFQPFSWLAILIMVVSLACSVDLGGSTPAAETQAPAATREIVATEAPAKTEAPVETEAPLETEAPVETEAAAPEGLVTSLDDLQSAVVEIGIQGSYKDPSEGWQVNSLRGGTGFIIDPSGLAVTNNHVVTGAAQLKVRVGESEEILNAKVLGVSECSDLAVIDIEGDGFPYVEWFDGDIKAGMDVYAAGFPAGAAESGYTLTKGIVSKSKTALDADFASVDNVIEHSARLNPGNSGGPLVSPDGQVVGVNYAGDASSDQNFAISVAIAQDLVEQLSEGDNVDSIGVNGVAVSGDLEGSQVTGIWVRSVESGSPADDARLIAGDIIVELEGQVMEVADMQAYCSVLRANNADDTLSMTVVRSNTLELMEGQINGRELETVGAWATGNTGGTTTGSDMPGTITNPNASASGEVYYEHSFDAGDLSEWSYFLTNGTEEGFEASIEDGRLRFEFDEYNTWPYFTYDVYSFTDVRIDVTAENLGRNSNNVSLICRYSADRGWYEFNIANSGEWDILRFDPAINGYRTLYTGGSNFINIGQATNSYTAICQGNELTLGINGHEIRTVKDNTLKEGTTGLSVSSFGITPIIVEFDHFTLSVP